MSNTLYIVVTKFESIAKGFTDYGFTAADSYSDLFVRGWNSLSDFKQDFPNADVLKEYVLRHDAFHDFSPETSGHIIVEWPE